MWKGKRKNAVSKRNSDHLRSAATRETLATLPPKLKPNFGFLCISAEKVCRIVSIVLGIIKFLRCRVKCFENYIVDRYRAVIVMRLDYIERLPLIESSLAGCHEMQFSSLHQFYCRLIEWNAGVKITTQKQLIREVSTASRELRN